MGKMNIVTKDYMSKPNYFADCFNYYLFEGRQIIRPENLIARDATELAVIPQNVSVETVEKYRDILKQCVLMEDADVTYLLLGIENQAEIHYALPVKNMIYDALNYGKQVSEKTSKHREKKNLKSGGEFLSGFSKEDKLKPIITLTIYFGSGEWDAPRSLKEMFDETDDTVLRFVEDYRVHLIIPKEIKDFDKFKTDFGKAMKYIAVSENRNEVQRLQNEEEFRSVDVETVQLINACTNSKIPIEGGKEKMNVCKGMADWIEEERREGRQEGRQEGITLTKQVFKLHMEGKQEEEIAIVCNITKEKVMEILR